MLILVCLLSPNASTAERSYNQGTTTSDAVPTVLKDQDIARYKKIFSSQQGGDWKTADRLISALENKILMGHVLYQRYMHPSKYRSSYTELSGWMRAYGDHPGSTRVYKLARKRKPKNAIKLSQSRRPSIPKFEIPLKSKKRKYVPSVQRTKYQRTNIRNLKNHILTHVRNGSLNRAVKHLKSREYSKVLTSTEIDLLYVKIVKSYLTLGNYQLAYEGAAQSAGRARPYQPIIDFYAGLAAWQMGDKTKAAKHFSLLALSDSATSRDIAAGAFWAARCYLSEGQPQKVLTFLKIGAGNSRTFYGQLALRLLGNSGLSYWHTPFLSTSDHDNLNSSLYVQRGIALSQIEQRYWAAREIFIEFQSKPPEIRKKILALAVKLDLPSAELRMARAIFSTEGTAYDRALFPLSPWHPERGLKLDRAILFAFMRQESGFNPFAKSKVGARGVMQLMPRTASFIAQDYSLRGRNKQKLFVPEYNLYLGQKYLLHLMNEYKYLDNLIAVIAAYNAGPGNVKKWQRVVKENADPLMFIEKLPSHENREFIRRVMVNIWIYRARLGQPSPSLDALAMGNWPTYNALDSKIKEVIH